MTGVTLGWPPLMVMGLVSVKIVPIIDFRDHHNFEKPLEFLTLNDKDFLNSCEYRYSRGSRVCFQQLEQMAESIGSHVEKLIQSETDSDYLEEFIPRLRQSSSRFRDIPADWLTILLAVVYFEKI
jgi:hypothetical protein